MPLDVSLVSPVGSSADSVGYNLSLFSWETADNNYHSTSWSPTGPVCSGVDPCPVSCSTALSSCSCCSLCPRHTDFLAVWECVGFLLLGFIKGEGWGPSAYTCSPQSVECLIGECCLEAHLIPHSGSLLPCPAVLLCCSLPCPSLSGTAVVTVVSWCALTDASSDTGDSMQ